MACCRRSAGQGIGKSIALRLAKDGYNIVVNDLPSKSLEVENVANLVRAIPGRKSLSILGDASSETDVSSMIDRTLLEMGGLHVVCAYIV